MADDINLSSVFFMHSVLIAKNIKIFFSQYNITFNHIFLDADSVVGSVGTVVSLSVFNTFNCAVRPRL